MWQYCSLGPISSISCYFVSALCTALLCVLYWSVRKNSVLVVTFVRVFHYTPCYLRCVYEVLRSGPWLHAKCNCVSVLRIKVAVRCAGGMWQVTLGGVVMV